MDFSELKDLKKVNVYIPVTGHFYEMEVTACPLADDGKGGYSITNFDTEPIEGHSSYMYRVRNQLDLDKFFYMERVAKGKPDKTSYERGEQKCDRNGKTWIF